MHLKWEFNSSSIPRSPPPQIKTLNSLGPFSSPSLVLVSHKNYHDKRENTFTNFSNLFSPKLNPVSPLSLYPSENPEDICIQTSIAPKIFHYNTQTSTFIEQEPNYLTRLQVSFYPAASTSTWTF